MKKRELSRFMNKESDDEDEDQITTTIGNKIYFYDSITKKNILNLFQEVEKLNNKLKQESQLYGFEPYIELHIHSGGGDLFSGISAYDILKKNKIPIHTIIEGEACSAATLIALSGKKRYITQNSMILVHQLRTWFSGKHNELEDELKTSEKLMNSLKNVYKKHSKLTDKQLSKIIEREEYLTSQECLSMGFVDEII
tara:strand:- start:589 stop:1179 length:591 start_codon:yes stop_codon:yes gene_type:complete